MDSPQDRVRVASRISRSIRSGVVIVMATLSIAACSYGAAEKPTTAGTEEGSASTPVSAPPPVSATATVGPGIGTTHFGGAAPDVPVKVTMPAGWNLADVFVLKSDSDPLVGIDFFDVANIYADGCQWKLLDPPPGPTVDDLVEAYAQSPRYRGPARAVAVDGFHGKHVRYGVPDYDPKECKEGKFGLVQEDHNPSMGDAPSLWAQSPNRQNEAWILDVHGTRLVILAGYPPNISPQDRMDIDGIISSLQIG